MVMFHSFLYVYQRVIIGEMFVYFVGMNWIFMMVELDLMVIELDFIVIELFFWRLNGIQWIFHRLLVGFNGCF